MDTLFGLVSYRGYRIYHDGSGATIFYGVDVIENLSGGQDALARAKKLIDEYHEGN